MIPPLNPPSQPSHILTKFAPLYRHFELASSAALNAHASGSLLKTLSCQKQVAATAQGEMAKNEHRGSNRERKGGEGGGRVHKRQVLCALSIFGCAPEQVVVVLAASMLTQCSARPTVYCQQPFATPPAPTLFSPSSSILSSACCTFWLCSGAQLK